MILVLVVKFPTSIGETWLTKTNPRWTTNEVIASKSCKMTMLYVFMIIVNI